MKFTPKKQKFINILASLEFVTIEEQCKKVGISKKTHWLWRKDSEIANAIYQESLRLNFSRSNEVMQALTKKAVTGDTKAIQLYFEMLNKYKLEDADEAITADDVMTMIAEYNENKSSQRTN